MGAARLRQEMSEKASLAERRSNALQGEMEEARALLDSAERGKRQTESELTEARMAVNEMNNVNSRAGHDKRSLEGAVHTLEAEIELGSVQARTSDNMKGHQKAERKIKELAFQNDEDKKNQVAMSDLASKLQSKIKTYKKQIEEAEEIATLSLAKFRKAQQELEETEDRNKMAEAQLAVRSF